MKLLPDMKSLKKLSLTDLIAQWGVAMIDFVLKF